MKRAILDTDVLIAHWHRCIAGSPRGKSIAQAEDWARNLVRLYDTDAIVTPVRIEFVAGTRTAHELRLARAYLAKLRAIDGGRILAEDWTEAQRIAERVPRDGKPRQLGDCLIAAIAKRLRYDVETKDRAFPR